MKAIWIYIIRGYVGIALFFCYRRIHVIDKGNVPKNKPVLFVSNHNNALIDALLIGTQSGRFSYFLTRASAFKKPLVNALLKSINMLPVYRMRDGWSQVSNNNSIFKMCSVVLSKCEAVTLFPEGNHNIKRSVRVLSKGFTRIIFETLDTFPDTNLQIVPIGLNFEQADAFADTMSIYFGEPISAKSYMKEDRNAQTVRLRADVSDEIKKLTTHIDVESYDDVFNKLEALDADFLNPRAVNKCIASNFKDCSFSKSSKPEFLKAIFKFLMILALIVPYAIWKIIAKPTIKEKEFVATFRFAIVAFLIPLWMLIIAVILGLKLGLAFAIYYILFTVITALLAVKL